MIPENLCCLSSIDTQDVATSSVQNTFLKKWGNGYFRICCLCDYSQDVFLSPCYNNGSSFPDCCQTQISKSISPSIHCRSSVVPPNYCQDASCIRELNTMTRGIFVSSYGIFKKGCQLYQTAVSEEHMKSDHLRNS